MGRLDITNGSEMSLLGTFGFVDTGKAIDAIKYSTGLEVLDIGFINNEASKGKLLFKESGKPLDDISEQSEREAQYMAIPIGYTDNNTGSALCASFMKGPIGWEGVYINCIKALVQRYIDHSDISDEEAETILEEFRGYYELEGFGFKEIQEHNKKLRQGLGYIRDTTLKREEKSKAEVATKKVEVLETSVAEVITETDTITKGNIQSLCSTIYSRLLFKEDWKYANYSKLIEYIKHICMKVSQDIESNKSNNGWILSGDKHRVCINTGLVDKFNSDIYVIDLDYEEKDIYKKNLIMIDGKSQLVKQGFSKESIIKMPKPVKFYENRSELIFEGTIEDFDIDNIIRLEHIIEERRHRFPDVYKDIPADVLCSKIRASVISAVRMSERDYKYFVPMYSFKYSCIQYLIPVYLDKSIGDIPELSAVIGMSNGFYCVYTVLNTDDAYNNARLISKPDNTWLVSSVL